MLKDISNWKYNKLFRKEKFKSERHNVFIEEINKIALSLNDDKRIQSMDSIETYSHGMSKNIICQKEKNKRISIINDTKVFNFADITKAVMTYPNPGSRKANALLNLINHEPDIDKIYSYTKNPYEAKYQLLINKRESTDLKYLNDPKAFIEYLNDMDNIYKNIEGYNPNKKRKILIAFDDMIADMFSNKKLNPMVTELFIRGRKLNISLVFITQFYFAVPKNIKLNSTHFFVMKISDKLHLTVHQMLYFKTLWIFIKSLLQNHILFLLLILLFHQLILHVLEKIF